MARGSSTATSAGMKSAKPATAPDLAPQDASSVGRAIMGRLMGEDFLRRKAGLRNSFNAVLQDYSEQVCFGRIWARPGLPPKQRSILNIAMLVASNRNNQLRTHIEGALNNGCTVEEIQEILLHTAVYCGLPAATDAFRVAEEVLKAKNLLD